MCSVVHYHNTYNDYTYKDFTYKDFTYKDFTYKDFTYKDFTYKDFTYKDFTYKDFTHNFRAVGFFNEADTLESSSIMISLFQEQSIYLHDTMLIKGSRQLMGAFYRRIISN